MTFSRYCEAPTAQVRLVSDTDAVPLHSTWQNMRSGRLVTVTGVFRAEDAVRVKWINGQTRTYKVDEFVSRYRHESEIGR